MPSPPSADSVALEAALQTIPWFQHLHPDHFASMAQIASLRSVQPRETLFREGDPEDYLYVLLKGRVALEINVPGRGRTRLMTAEPLDVIGWSSVTPVVRRRTATAVAVLPSELVALDAPALLRRCEADPGLGYVVMRRLANVVAQRLLVTRLQLLDMYAHPAEEGRRE